LVLDTLTKVEGDWEEIDGDILLQGLEMTATQLAASAAELRRPVSRNRGLAQDEQLIQNATGSATVAPLTQIAR
jgi:hypothetical protein